MTVREMLAENELRKARASAVAKPSEFELWAKENVKIKPKGGGAAIPFVLNAPQRQLVAALEKMRKAEKPIRLILLKARQWGGSTCVQIYMSWLQIEHSAGLNSLIIAHQISGSEQIKDMFDRMVENYEAEPLTLKRMGRSGATFRLVERDSKITIGTAERPDSSRGGDYNLVHLSEVGLWKKTKGKSPEDIVRSATSGVLFKPLTLIVLESTANGAGTYFHREYLAAKDGESQFEALFIPWFEIEAYRLEPDDPEIFASTLIEHRDSETSTDRSQSGAYLWSLWERGATLEAINWYVNERKKYSSHGAMASEYPSDDIEAFNHSGERVFASEAIDLMRRNVTDPEFIGEIDVVEEKEDDDIADIAGFDLVPKTKPPKKTLKFVPDSCGHLEIWKQPAEDKGMNRYLAVVDIGGRSSQADWSVIAVFDRLGDSDYPEIVAQWRGHTDHDKLADIAAMIGAYYGNALLVIESNTLETRDSEREIDGEQAPFILRSLNDRYPNLYMRVGANGSVRPGFHTNSATKPMVIGTMVKAVREGLYIERDKKAIEEMIQYERKPGGSYGAYTGCHDDIVMTRAIGLHIHEFEMETPRRESKKKNNDKTKAYPQDQFGKFGGGSSNN